MKNFTILAAVFAALALSAGNASAADAAKGKKVYNKCKACHALKAGKNKVGPTLHGSSAAKRQPFQASSTRKR